MTSIIVSGVAFKFISTPSIISAISCLSSVVGQLAQGLGVKDSFLLAVVKRTPSLRLEGKHTLQLCAGPNCGKQRQLEALARELADPQKVTVELVGCMRLCGKGPNLRYDGRLYHAADEELLRQLLKE